MYFLISPIYIHMYPYIIFVDARLNMKLVASVRQFDHAGRRAVQLHSHHDINKKKKTGCSIA